MLGVLPGCDCVMDVGQQLVNGDAVDRARVSNGLERRNITPDTVHARSTRTRAATGCAARSSAIVLLAVRGISVAAMCMLLPSRIGSIPRRDRSLRGRKQRRAAQREGRSSAMDTSACGFVRTICCRPLWTMPSASQALIRRLTVYSVSRSSRRYPDATRGKLISMLASTRRPAS